LITKKDDIGILETSCAFQVQLLSDIHFERELQIMRLTVDLPETYNNNSQIHRQLGGCNKMSEKASVL
jgi:hypothetical protein